MKEVYLDRSGLLKNTTFAILSPNGRKKLTRAGRGPFFEFRNARLMAAGMDKIAKEYAVEEATVSSDTNLPFAESVEIGLNISAADNIPMIVLVASDDDNANKLEQKVLPLAWKDDSIIGQFTYAKATDANELSTLTGIERKTEGLSAILVVEPGQFGLSGKVIAQLTPEVSEEELKKTLGQAIMNCQRIAKSHNSHVKLGIQLGIDWESEIPESDPESVRARRRARGNK